MKLRIYCTWTSAHEVEIDDEEVALKLLRHHQNLENFPEDVLAEMSAHLAELTDWEVEEL